MLVNYTLLRTIGGRLQRLKDSAARRARKAVSSMFGAGRESQQGGAQPGGYSTPTRWGGGDSGSSPEVDPGRRPPRVNLLDLPEFQD